MVPSNRPFNVSLVRPRTLVLLVSSTAIDCLLWHWSLADGHDILALASGMTLLPLAAVSGAFLGVQAMAMAARLARYVPQAAVRRTQRRQTAPASRLPEGPQTADPEAPSSSTGRLAA
jgi:hypothetical protein